MNAIAPLIAWLLVLVTLAVAAIFARQQIRTLRTLPKHTDMAPEDQRYFRRQAWRRLVGCALLAAVAGMMSGWYISDQDGGIDKLGDEVQAQHAAGEHNLTPEQEYAKRFYVYYVGTMLLLLLGLLMLAAVDLYAIRCYARRHSQKIRDDRRAMLERELAALRRERGFDRGNPSLN